MRITILNGNPGRTSFDNYLADLETELEAKHHTVTQVNLRELTLRYCIGCFGCWVKTPGVCNAKDESCEMRLAVIHSDFTLWAAPLKMGFPSALLKTALDKSIPLIHPYIIVDHTEAHHRKRYDHYPRFGLLVDPEPDTDAVDLDILGNIFSRTALNLKSRLEFVLTTNTPVTGVVNKFTSKPKTFVSYKKGLAPISGDQISPPKKLVLFNGSPRGSKGNTPIMLKQFGEGFASIPGNTYELHNLIRLKSLDKYTKAYEEAECVWMGFPLYTDAMPGTVKTFIETLESLKERKENPPLGFLVQSGFPEALHSRYIERYLQKLARRLGAPYLGTIVKGSGEGVRMMPDERNAKLFRALQVLGGEFAQFGALNTELLKEVAGVERYPLISMPFFHAFLRTSFSTWYWDHQLKENGVFEKRFDQPYANVDQ